MKANVDLTLDRDFRGSTEPIFDTFTDIERYISDTRSLYKWNSALTLITSLEDKDELVLTGNASERKHKMFWDEDEGQRWLECDRCGAFTKDFPWDVHESTLCKNCEEWLKLDGEKVHWRGRVGRL